MAQVLEYILVGHLQRLRSREMQEVYTTKASWSRCQVRRAASAPPLSSCGLFDHSSRARMQTFDTSDSLLRFSYNLLSAKTFAVETEESAFNW